MAWAACLPSRAGCRVPLATRKRVYPHPAHGKDTEPALRGEHEGFQLVIEKAGLPSSRPMKRALGDGPTE